MVFRNLKGAIFIMEKDYLSELEYVECYLSEDVQALGYLIEEWFSANVPDTNFRYSFFEIQNRLNLLFRSMVLNRNDLRKVIAEAYAERKQNKEGNKCEI